MKAKDEFDDEEFKDDKWIFALGEMIAQEESEVFLAVPNAVCRVWRVYQILRHIIDGTDVEITCNLPISIGLP